VNGTFGGASPFPSGNGTLAFVEFTVLGTRSSAIDVTGSVVSDASVPEPGTLALFTAGLLVSGARRLFRSAGRR
jgi:hypothetical protein